MAEIAYRGNIRDLTPTERPREKFRQSGAAALSDVELLAVILGSGTVKYPVLTLCENLLKTAGGSLEKLAELDVEALCRTDGIGEVRALTFLAAVALAKILNSLYAETRVPRIGDADMAVFLDSLLAEAEGRHLLMVLLNPDRRLLATVELAIEAALLPDIDHVIRIAADAGAAKFFMARNTREDNLVDCHLENDYCMKLEAAARMMQLEFEGLIVGKEGNFRWIISD